MSYADSSRHSIQDRKGIRKGILINALTETQLLQENVSLETVIHLDSVIASAEVINNELSLDEKVENQDEVVLDSEVMKSSSNVIKECTNYISKDWNSYSTDEYCKYLMEHIFQVMEVPPESDEVVWNSLEMEIIPFFKKTPFFSTLSGSLEPLPKLVIERRSERRRELLSQIKRPEKTVILEKEEQPVEVVVGKIRKLIVRFYKKHQKSLDFFQLVLHPTDFGRTVENILHVSFLVRDGLISLSSGNNGALEIVPCTKEGAKSGKNNIQNILSINVQQWKILTAHYKIVKPMIDFRVDQDI